MQGTLKKEYWYAGNEAQLLILFLLGLLVLVLLSLELLVVFLL